MDLGFLVKETRSKELVRFLLAGYLSIIGNYQGAIDSYSDAIKVDKESRKQGYMKRGILYLQLGQHKKGDQIELK